MKTVLTILFALMLSESTMAQVPFKWDIIDSTSFSKNEIYSQTKMFIAETWKSSNNVIQNDDKDGGAILVKGISIQNRFFALNDHKWSFSYNVKFMFKENRYRIIIQDVHCVSAGTTGSPWPLLPTDEGYPEKNGLLKTSINRERYEDIMMSLREELQLIVDLYKVHMVNNQNKQETDW